MREEITSISRDDEFQETTNFKMEIKDEGIARPESDQTQDNNKNNDETKKNIIHILQPNSDENSLEDVGSKERSESNRKDETTVGEIRPSLPRGPPKTKPAYKRVELCIMDKIRVIAAGTTGLSQRQVAKQFGISKTQVQTLMKRKDEVLQCYNEGHESWRKRAKTKSRRHGFEDLNELVWEWYLEQNSNGNEGVMITGPMLKAKAMEISVQLGLGEQFRASNGWLECLKRRYDIQIGRKNQAENSSRNVESATMVAIQRNSDSDVEIRNGKKNENIASERRSVVENEVEVNASQHGGVNNAGQEKFRQEEKRVPMIHNVYSMQRPHPVIQPVQPVLLPPTYEPQSVSLMNQQQHVVTTRVNNLQTLAEAIGQEATGQIQVKTYNEAMKCANALKGFAVEKCSVTLIGLMTAMEHELQRERNNSTAEN